MTDPKLKSIAERIGRLMDERDGLGADIRDIYTEAKSAGYVPKVLRKAITRKRMDKDKRDEEDAILELYEDALGNVGRAVAAVRAGATWKEAAEKTGVPRATLARAVAVSKRREETRNDTHDPDAGEITPPVEMGAGGEEDARQGSDLPRCAEPSSDVAANGGEGRCGPGLSTGSHAHELWRAKRRCMAPAAACPSTPPQHAVCTTDPLPMKPELGAEASEPEHANTISTPGTAHEGEDDLAFPAFLRASA